MQKRFRFLAYLIYFILFLSAIAALAKPIVYWALPLWGGLLPAQGVLQVSASVDAIAFIFEYLLGVYIQVYLIAVCFAWIRGLSFEEGELFRFAMRRFSYVLEWAGIIVVVSTLIVRLPLLLAYFMNIPDVLDYLPIERVVMCGLVIAFSSMQISLALRVDWSVADALGERCATVILASRPSIADARDGFAHGLAGYLDASLSTDVLRRALRGVLSGELAYGRDITFRHTPPREMTHGGRDCPRRNRRSPDRDDPLEIDLCFSPRLYHRLAARVLGLFVPSRRNWRCLSTGLDRILSESKIGCERG